jgi:hypothetical protein
MFGQELTVVDQERDLGVLITSNLKQNAQCQKAAGTATMALTQILRTFSYRDRAVLPKLYIQHVRPHLEYAVQAWAPWQVGDCALLENVQKRMVKQVTGLRGTNYEDRLTELGLDTLQERRARLDLCQTHKILHHKDQVKESIWFTRRTSANRHPTRRTAGGFTLEKPIARLEMRRNFFSNRVVDMWNELPLETRQTESIGKFRTGICMMPGVRDQHQ